MSAPSAGRGGVFRPGGISYLHIPAPDPGRSAGFYRAVFCWQLGGDPDRPSFQDGTGHVIGHFMSDIAAAGASGVQPYVYVDSLDETLAKLDAEGAEQRSPAVPGGRPLRGDVPGSGRQRHWGVAAWAAGLTRTA